MLNYGEKVIVWDSDIQDMYTAEVAQVETDELHVNPLVKVVSLICYPMQHAVMAPDLPSENAPIPKGTVCRLKLICRGWLCFDQGYETALADTRQHMLDSILARIDRSGNRLTSITAAAARKEAEILMEHEAGRYGARTLMGRDEPFVLPSTSARRASAGG